MPRNIPEDHRFHSGLIFTVGMPMMQCPPRQTEPAVTPLQKPENSQGGCSLEDAAVMSGVVQQYKKARGEWHHSLRVYENGSVCYCVNIFQRVSFILFI
jgi:hypothetical protein